MKTFVNPGRSQWEVLCRRPFQQDAGVRPVVEEIIGKVRTEGDSALRELSERIDKVTLQEIEVSREEIAEAAEAIPASLKKAIEDASRNIAAFHRAQLPKEIEVTTAPGVRCIQRPVPIKCAGLYIPGGTAPLFSTVLMLAIPARLAGCRQVILCTPPGRDGKVAPAVLAAASMCNIDHIYKAGGAQAIAAMAYGTETIPRADKIFGPGNRYVTMAKQILGGTAVAVDMPAGPSEVMVIADSTSNPAFIAADLLSQAEHGRDSQVMLVATDAALADRVQKEIEAQTRDVPRAEFIFSALEESRIVVLESEEDIIDFADTYAPEHLIISTAEPWRIADRVSCAGSVFVGQWTPESAGDYASGTNHTLPTSAWARSMSGVNIDSFIRKMTLQEITREGLQGLGGTIVTMADAEGLSAHANAVKVRLK